MIDADAWLYVHPEFGVEVHLTRWGSATGGRFDDFIGWNETPLFLSTADLQARLDAAEAKNAELVGLMRNLASIDRQWVDAQGGVDAAIDRIIGETNHILARTQGETP